MKLSKTEKLVCAHIATGYEVKEIAAKLFRSYHTIASTIRNVRYKNGYRNVAEMTTHFVLKYGDPKKLVAIAFLALQIGMIYSETRIFRRNFKISKTKKISYKRSRTREYYI